MLDESCKLGGTRQLSERVAAARAAMHEHITHIGTPLTRHMQLIGALPTEGAA